MVSSFKNISAHKEEVLRLYKTLVRHTQHLPIENDRRASLVHKIRFAFKERKSHMAGGSVRKSIEEGYDLEERLRKVFKNPRSKVLKEFEALEEPPTFAKVRYMKFKKLYDIKHSTPKPDGDGVQSLREQREGSYINHHVKAATRAGLMPKVVDPEIFEHIVKPEALFKKAKVDLTSMEQKLARGPFKVREIVHNNITFLRTMRGQDQEDSDRVLAHQIAIERVLRIEPEIEANKRWCKMETNWEKQLSKLDQTIEVSDWSKFINEAFEKQKSQIKQEANESKVYAANILPKRMIQRQAEANIRHDELRAVYANIISEIKDATPHDDLLGLELLPEIIRRYKVEGRGRKRVEYGDLTPPEKQVIKPKKREELMEKNIAEYKRRRAKYIFSFNRTKIETCI